MGGCCAKSSVTGEDVFMDENTLSSWNEESDDKEKVTESSFLESLIAARKKDIGFNPLATYFAKDKVIVASIYGLFSSEGATQSTKSVIEFHPPITKITSQLYFGSYENAMDEKQLFTHKITHIISLIGPTHLIKGIQHMHSPMNDYGRSDLNDVLEKLWPFIVESQQMGNSLFVHCMSGQNRSATIVIAILMRRHGKMLYEAFKMVKKKRPVVQINEGYAEQLLKIECDHFGRTSLPVDWMKITSFDMNTGKVQFSGDTISCTPSVNNSANNSLVSVSYTRSVGSGNMLKPPYHKGVSTTAEYLE